jgi:hypothetical protein
VLSKGCKLVKPGYSRLTGAAAKVTDRGEKLGNSGRVSRTEQHYRASLAGLTKTAARIDEQVRLAGLATRSRK